MSRECRWNNTDRKNQSLLFIEKIAAYGDSHIKHINTPCEQMQSFVDQVVNQHVVITVL
jgi:hypothetical protein